MKLGVRKGLALAGVVVGASALAFAGAAPASAKSTTSSAAIPGGTMKAYAYIQDYANSNNCGSFNTNASSTKVVSAITNTVQWDPIGIGGSASIQGVGVSVSGNGGGSPTASITGNNTTSAGIQGTACMSWSTIYLGVYSTAGSRINNTYYSVTAHL
ncbi:hypothetical protein KNO15_05945 [Leifsonia shinshuensis]|uniref:hypothetical protein n=1 Tax=Leifsonia shinshuensis TaxID=150026 RepID=UPI001F50FF57|nr:hypothetical protein [Leifsonia shinshuensis]MCI0156237.1 hypothetical protein [Leifsonia shinshuensis]